MAVTSMKTRGRRGEEHLRKSDPVMSRLVAAHGPCALASYEYRPFHTLVVSIISQQLSSKAAETIEARVAKIVPPPFQPGGFLAVPVSALRPAGLSQAKASYIRELALRASTGTLSFEELRHRDDETVVATLTALPGIGRWTAEMFLIFGLQRLDVLSVGDAGLRRAARSLYGAPGRAECPLSVIAEQWRPYRSIASWYLWRYLDDDNTR